MIETKSTKPLKCEVDSTTTLPNRKIIHDSTTELAQIIYYMASITRRIQCIVFTAILFSNTESQSSKSHENMCHIIHDTLSTYYPPCLYVNTNNNVQTPTNFEKLSIVNSIKLSQFRQPLLYSHIIMWFYWLPYVIYTYTHLVWIYLWRIAQLIA